jgi:hypothetical protein
MCPDDTVPVDLAGNSRGTKMGSGERKIGYVEPLGVLDDDAGAIAINAAPLGCSSSSTSWMTASHPSRTRAGGVPCLPL